VSNNSADVDNDVNNFCGQLGGKDRRSGNWAVWEERWESPVWGIGGQEARFSDPARGQPTPLPAPQEASPRGSISWSHGGLRDYRGCQADESTDWLARLRHVCATSATPGGRPAERSSRPGRFVLHWPTREPRTADKDSPTGKTHRRGRSGQGGHVRWSSRHKGHMVCGRRMF
jgi:hypothetical protein